VPDSAGITKPFHYPELLARIGGRLLRRVSRADKRTQFRIEELVVDTLAKRVTVGGHTVALSVKEFQLLATLAANPEKVFSKRELLEQVWDFKSHGRTRTLDSHASRLRQKLAEYSDRQWVVNVWGHGYRITAPES
jgi:DNA-binding response OmpR family regulator